MSGMVRLLTNYNLYLAPFLTSSTTDALNLPNLLFFFVPRVTMMVAYSPGASLDLSGEMLYSEALMGFKSKNISTG